MHREKRMNSQLKSVGASRASAVGAKAARTRREGRREGILGKESDGGEGGRS